MDKDVDDIELEQGSDFNDPRPNNVKGGTLSGLVRMLTYYKYPDPEYTHAMLMTYRSFTTSEELLSLIIERFFFFFFSFLLALIDFFFFFLDIMFLQKKCHIQNKLSIIMQRKLFQFE